MVSRVRLVEAGWIAREFGGTRATRGMERRVISCFWEFDQDGAWVVEKPYDVEFEDVGWFFDVTKSPETLNGVVPNGSLQ